MAGSRRSQGRRDHIFVGAMRHTPVVGRLDARWRRVQRPSRCRLVTDNNSSQRDPKPKCGFGRDRSLKIPEAGVWLAWRRIRVDARRASDGGASKALPQTGGLWQGVKMVPTAPPPLRPISPRARSKTAMSAHAKLRSSKEAPNGGNHSYCARVHPKQEAVRWRHQAVQPCTNKSSSVRPLRANHAALRG